MQFSLHSVEHILGHVNRYSNHGVDIFTPPAAERENRVPTICMSTSLYRSVDAKMLDNVLSTLFRWTPAGDDASNADHLLVTLVSEC